MRATGHERPIRHGLNTIRPMLESGHRLVYEMLSQYIVMCAQSPGRPLTVSVGPSMDDVDKLSALLQQKIIPRSWPYPQSVPL